MMVTKIKVSKKVICTVQEFGLDMFDYKFTRHLSSFKSNTVDSRLSEIMWTESFSDKGEFWIKHYFCKNK